LPRAPGDGNRATIAHTANIEKTSIIFSMKLSLSQYAMALPGGLV
jgi:hypothetical protein